MSRIPQIEDDHFDGNSNITSFIEESNENLASIVQFIKNDIEDNEFDITSIQSDITNIENDVINIQNDITTIESKLYEVVNVKSYGATGDGITDDTSAIQTAAAVIQSAGGGTLYFSPGTYLVSVADNTALIDLSNISNVNIIGSGAILKTEDFTDGNEISNLTYSAPTATATTTNPHGLVGVVEINISGSSDIAYHGRHAVTVTGPNSFTYTPSYTPSLSGITSEWREVNYDRKFIGLTTCENIVINKLRFEGVVQDRSIQSRCGYSAIEAQTSCKNISIDVDCEGLSYGFRSGNYGVDVDGGGEFFNIRLNAVDVGYPSAVWLSGHNSTYNLWSDSTRRGGFFQGASNIKVNIWAKNYDVTGALFTLHYGTGGALTGFHNVDANVTDYGTDEPYSQNIGVGKYAIAVSWYSGSGSPIISNLNLKAHVTLAGDIPVTPILVNSFSNCTYDSFTYDVYHDRTDVGTVYATGDVITIGESTSGVGTWKNQKILRSISRYPGGVTRGQIKINMDNYDDEMIIEKVEKHGVFNLTMAGGSGSFKIVDCLGLDYIMAGLVTSGVNATVIVARDYTLNDVTVPSNTTLEVREGSIITVNTGKTLTINGSFKAGNYQCFTESGTGVVTFANNSITRPNPLWWGLTKNQTITDGDTTPSVKYDTLFTTANTAPTTITNFDNGLLGQEIVVIFGDANTTVDFTGTNLKGNSGVDWSPAQDDSMRCIYDGTNWYCTIS